MTVFLWIVIGVISWLIIGYLTALFIFSHETFEDKDVPSFTIACLLAWFAILPLGVLFHIIAPMWQNMSLTVIGRIYNRLCDMLFYFPRKFNRKK